MNKELLKFLNCLQDNGFSVHEYKNSFLYVKETKIDHLSVIESYETNKEKCSLTWKNISISFSPDLIDEIASADGGQFLAEVRSLAIKHFSAFGVLDLNDIDAGNVNIEPVGKCPLYSDILFMSSAIEFIKASSHIFKL